MRSVENNEAEGPSWKFYKILGVCFNTVGAVFPEIFGYRYTDRQAYIKFHLYTLYTSLYTIIKIKDQVCSTVINPLQGSK